AYRSTLMRPTVMSSRVVPGAAVIELSADTDLVFELFELGAAGHQPGQLGLRDLLFGEVAEAVPAIEEQEAIADRIGVVWVVGDEDHAEAALCVRTRVLQHHTRLLVTERGLRRD